MKTSIWPWVERLSAFVLIVAIMDVTLIGCSYKHYTFPGKTSVIRTYMAQKYYLILYGRDGIFHLSDPVLKHDTLYGNLTQLDQAYLSYVTSDTLNRKVGMLQHRYHPAEAVHVMTDMSLATGDSLVKISINSIQGVEVYHWKMKKNAKIILLCSIGTVFIGLIFLGVASMEDMSIGGLGIGSK